MEGLDLTEFNRTTLARPDAAVVNEARVAARKAKRTQMDAPRGPGTWTVKAEEVAVAGVDYPGDEADPFYDERVLLPLDPVLLADIDANGVTNPPEVVMDGEVVKAKDGRRRVMHLRAANILRERRGDAPHPLVVRLGKGDAKDIFLGARRANAHAKVDGVLQRGKNAARAMKHFGATVEEIASAEGVDARTVRDWLEVIDLGPEAHAAIDAHRISPSGAVALLANVARKDRASVLAQELSRTGGKVSIREAEAGAKNYRAEQAEKAKPAALPGAGAPAAPTPEKAEARPTRGTTRKLLKLQAAEPVYLGNDAEGSTEFTDGFLAAVRWQRGDWPATKIKGLTAALKKLKK